MTSTPIATHIDSVLACQGLRARGCLPLSGPGEGKRGRWAYRVETVGGEVVKVRRLESAEAAERLVELRAGLERAFAPVIARSDAVLVEGWIEGTPLREPIAAKHIEEAGALLGRLHASALPGGPRSLATRPWRDAARDEIVSLRARGLLEVNVATGLADELRRRDPASVPAAIIHQDFCPENMVIDATGCLRVIDNEWQAIGPAGFDLGRTFSRWSMPAATRERFLDAYRSEANGAPRALRFWKLAAALWGARIRRDQPELLAPVLEEIRNLAAGAPLVGTGA